VVLVGLAFEVLELPSLAGRVGHQAADAEFATEIVDPAGEQTGLDDDYRRLFLGQQAVQLAACRLEAGEAKLAGRFVVDAGDALLLAQVDGDNGGRGRGNRVHGASLRW